MRNDQLKSALAALVVVHFIVAAVHGAAHRGAHVDLTPVAFAFVIVVILIGPIAGLVLAFVMPRIGTAMVAVTMAGALLFGVINHFLLQGIDQVAHVDVEWRTLFGASAAALAVLEAGGVIAATLLLRRSPAPLNGPRPRQTV